MHVPRRASGDETRDGAAASPRDAAARGSGAGLRPLRDLDEGGEGLRVAHGDVGQHLPVELDAGQAKAVDETAVARAVGTGGGVDALDPELAEVAFAGAAVTIGVLPRVHELLVGRAERAALVAVVALRLLEDGPAVLAPVDGALDPCHLETEELAGLGAVAAGELGLAPEASRARRRLLLHQVTAVGLATEQSAGAGDLEALGCAAVRLHLRNLRSPARPPLRPSWPPPGPACRGRAPSPCCVRRAWARPRSWRAARRRRRCGRGSPFPARGGPPL